MSIQDFAPGYFVEAKGYYCYLKDENYYGFDFKRLKDFYCILSKLSNCYKLNKEIDLNYYEKLKPNYSYEIIIPFHFRNKECNFMIKRLNECPIIKSICFNNYIDINSICFKPLIDFLKNNNSLLSLTFRYNHLFNKLYDGLRYNNTLTELNFIGLYIDDEFCYLLSNLLKNNTSLCFLNFSNSTFYNFKSFCEGLKNNLFLTDLNLCNTKLKNKDLYELNKILKINSNITSLDLSNNNLSSNNDNEDELIYLIDILKSNSFLTNLNLRQVNLNGNCLNKLTDLLTNNSNLSSLDLSYNDFSHNNQIFMLYFINSLKFNYSLTNLNLQHINLTNKCLIKLGKILKINSSLISLNISYNKLKTSNINGLLFFINSLKSNHSLTSLNINYINHFNKNYQLINNSLINLLDNNITLTKII